MEKQTLASAGSAPAGGSPSVAGTTVSLPGDSHATAAPALRMTNCIGV
ncbi:MAG: hypothetical protein ACLUSP_05560 [Christensenellales bacterium]